MKQRNKRDVVNYWKGKSTLWKGTAFLYIFLGAIILALLILLFFFPNNMLRAWITGFLLMLTVIGMFVIVAIITWLEDHKRAQKTHTPHSLPKQPKLDHEQSQVPHHYKIGDDGEIIEVKEKAKRS